jgi:hypothetical protein
LVVYFLRRIYTLLRPGGFTAFITTNSIKDGDVRKDGLEQVIAAGGSIHFAVRGTKWPGRANLVVSLVGIHKGEWKANRSLDGGVVPSINAYFEEAITVDNPTKLTENATTIYQGSIFLGDGFLLSHENAKLMIKSDPLNALVVSKIINGQELNNEPDQSPGRSIINFRDWNLDKARQYQLPFAIVEKDVKPERDKQKDAGGKEYWWRFLRPRIELYSQISLLKRCFTSARTTKYLSFSALDTSYVFSDAIYVFTTDRWDLFSVVQSTLHEVWARKYSGALKQDLRYSPTNCFETFAFPKGLWVEADIGLAEIGERYHEHRRQMMHRLWLGLTDVYNLFHSEQLEANLEKHFGSRAKKDPEGLLIPEEHRAEARAFTMDEAITGIQELRRLHTELDHAVLKRYGWDLSGQDGPAIDLGHGFYDVETLPENDRRRYTISPTARRELLTRLLAENHRRAAETPAEPPAPSTDELSEASPDNDIARKQATRSRKSSPASKAPKPSKTTRKSKQKTPSSTPELPGLEG